MIKYSCIINDILWYINLKLKAPLIPNICVFLALFDKKRANKIRIKNNV